MSAPGSAALRESPGALKSLSHAISQKFFTQVDRVMRDVAGAMGSPQIFEPSNQSRAETFGLWRCLSESAMCSLDPLRDSRLHRSDRD